MALTDGILAYWNLNDDGEGGLSLVDSTGNSNTLTNDGGVTLGSGIIKGGALFNGENKRLVGNSLVTIGNPISVAFWANSSIYYDQGRFYDDASGYGIAFATGAGGANSGVFVVALNGNSGAGWINTDYTIPTSQWVHFVTTLDGSYNLTVYANGSSVFTTNIGENNGPWLGGTATIGNDCRPGEDSRFVGSLDEIGIWNRVLSQQEVTKLYNDGVGKTYPFNQLYYNNAESDGDWGNILNWWQFDDFTIQADALPTSSNQVNLYNAVSQNSQGANQCFCSSANFWSANFGTGLTLQASGVVNMYGGSVLSGTTTDGVSMHDSSYIDIPGVVGGDAVLRDSSRNTGLIQGNATVYYDMGNGQFPIGGTVTGSVTYIDFPVSTLYFNDKNTEDQDWSNYLNWWNDAEATIQASNIPNNTIDVIVNSKSIYSVTGSPAICKSATFNNHGVIGIDFTTVNGAIFNNGVNDGGVITGNATFNGDSDQAGAVTGLAKFTSNQSLNNSFGYNGLSTGAIDSFEAAIPTKKKISISSLLGFPWFINF